MVGAGLDSNLEFLELETYQLIGVAVMVGMGFVVHSTMSLNRLRNVMGVPKAMFNFRDLTVLRDPGQFDPLEVKLVRTNWLACIILFALILVLINVIPDELVRELEASLPKS